MAVKNLFQRLNVQFILYFLLFSYVPLLLFSVLGYFLNKNLISRVYQSVLAEANLLVTQRVEDYLEASERRVLALSERILSLPPEQYSQDSGDQPTQWEGTSPFPVVWFRGGQVIFEQNLDEDLRPIFFEFNADSADFSSAPGEQFLLIKKDVPDDLRILYGLPMSDIKKRLRSVNENINHWLMTPVGPITKMTARSGNDPAADQTDILQIPDEKNSFDHEHYLERRSSLNGYTGLSVMSLVRRANIFSELRTFLLEIILANIVIGLLMMVVAILLSRKITTPIRSLVNAVNMMSKGDLTQPIVINSQDEIRTLANEFERMRRKLLESYTTLETKIEERTQALRQAQFQISHQEKMASLGLLAAGVAHEIGNPLTSISSMAQIIKRKVKDQAFIEYLNTILKNIDRIRKIVRELVDFARPSSYEASDTNVNEIIRTAVGIVKYDRRTKSINIELELDNNLPTLYLVSDQLLQVFINILINAVDALTEERNRIIVRSFKKGNEIVIEFEDTGIGIDEAIINKIFEPFFTTKEVGKGTGLGLSVSYGIIKNLDGKIDVSSKIGEGSIFTITLPRIVRS